jgi:hypothetical protein
VRRSSFLVVALALAGAFAGPAQASHWRLGACGLPTQRPLHVEYAEFGVSPVIRTEIFGPARPALVLATSGTRLPAELRAAGAYTIYWRMKLAPFVGTPQAPADPAAVPAAADALFAKAAEQSACATPLIALNELAGAYLSTPWTPTYAQYRANVLELLRRLHARGAHPYLLVTTSPRPFTESVDAVAWWRDAAQLADLVLEMHFQGAFISRQGPIAGNRRRRAAMRRALAQFTAIGVPGERLGLLHGFQSGIGGRGGLPLSQWLRVVKWETLAAAQVAAERAAAGTPLASDWSWGWGDFPDLSPVDPDKPVIACVYLWTRDPNLCDGAGRAALAGVLFNASRTEGQLVLPAGVQCTVARPRRIISIAALDALAAITTDAGVQLGRPAALSILFGRVAENRRVFARKAEIDRAERRIVATRFAGNPLDYEAALAARNVTPAIARALIGDQIRRTKLAAQLRGVGRARAWTLASRTQLLATTTCVADEVPPAAPIEQPSQLAFLRLA